MNENNMKDFELDELSDELYADAPGLDPELEWKEEAVTESPIEEASVERIGDFMVRNGNEAVEYVGTSTVVVIPEGITKIDSFFLEGKTVTEVHIPSTVTEISGAAFFEAPDLKNIFVDEDNPAYKSIDGCLYDKSGKTFIRCPSDRELVEIAEGTEKVVSCAFFQCSVKEIKLPSTLKILEEGAFTSCSIWERMDELVLPYGIEFGKEVFMYSTLPPHITLQGITKLPERAFANATFGMVRLPDTLTEIGDYALSGNDACRVYIPKSVTKMGKGVFNYYYSDGTEGYFEDDLEPDVYPCPDGFVLGVDNEECYAAQYARENNIPYEVVTDIEAFLNVERPEIYHRYEMIMESRNQQTNDDSPF